MSDPARSLWLGSGGSYVGLSRAPVWGEDAAGVTYKCCLQVSYGNGIAETFLGVPAELCVPAAPTDNGMVPVLGFPPPGAIRHPTGMASKLCYPPPGISTPQGKGHSLDGVAAAVNCPRSQAEAPLHQLSIRQWFPYPPVLSKEGFRWGAGARPVLWDLNPALLAPDSSLLAPPGQCLRVLSLPFLLQAVPYLSPLPSVPA